MMGRLAAIVDEIEAEDEKIVVGEIELLDGRPDNIPKKTWDLIKENGHLATTRLNEILRSPRFSRLKAGDQAKLIALAQNRAYGNPVAHKQDTGKKRGNMKDVINAELDNMAMRTNLPEYRNTGVKNE